MSTNPINGNGGVGFLSPLRPLTPGEQRPLEQPAANGTQATKTETPAHTRRVAEATAGVPVEAPPGTDPQLWSVLTAEERAFFAKATALGPLTYGPTVQAPAPGSAPRGGRIDLKV